MKSIYRILGVALFAILFQSCTEDFEQINSNPNAPQSVDPQFLLTNIISTAADRNTYQQGFRLSNYLAQFAASVEFERIDRYEMGSNSTYWNTLYQLQADIETMKTAPASNDAYKAVGDILSCYISSQLTDMWGDVPYTEAAKAVDGIYTPVYDTQEAIYTNTENGILVKLQNAANTLQSTNNRVLGDVMFGGNLDKWVRFANSLRFRYLLRISNKYEASSQLQELMNSNLLMQSNEDNAVVPYLASAPNQWPMSFSSLGLYQEHRMTATVDSVLTVWNDPRIKVLYKPTQQSVLNGTPDYKGLQNGLNRETIGERNINLNDISLFGAIFRDVPDGVDAQFMQFAELQFAKAEAVTRGLIEGSAQEFYESGIRASFEYFDTLIPSDYLQQTTVQLDGINDLEKICTQKWLSLINNGHEAWFLIRRTGFPRIKAGPDNLNDDRLPVRYTYPESEQATNSVNYQEAVQRMGGDHINSKVWWEQ